MAAAPVTEAVLPTWRGTGINVQPAVVQQQLVKVLLGYVDAALVPQQGPASEMQVSVASQRDCIPPCRKLPLRCRALCCASLPIALVFMVLQQQGQQLQTVLLDSQTAALMQQQRTTSEM